MPAGGSGPNEPMLRIAGGAIEVELLPGLGGRLHRLRAFGHDVLRTPRRLELHRDEPVAWGAYPMAPWCNRLAAVPTAVGDRLVDLPATYADGTAIHGQVSTAAWSVEPDGRLAVRGGGDGWPWPYEVVERVTVTESGARIELQLRNLGDDPMLGGVGLHPWFRRPLELRVAGSNVVPSNTDPASELEAVSGELDLRRLGAVPGGLDGTWTDLAEPAVELRWPGLGLAAVMSVRSEAGPCVAVASPAGVDAVAVEPETHLPGGLARFLRGSRGGLVAIEPGAALRLTIDLEFEQERRGSKGTG